jgi:cellobiose phosphorylase
VERERARVPLTPWSNDPVSDPNSEAFYLRDEGQRPRLVADAAADARRPAPYVARHGFGYSVFEHERGRHRRRRFASTSPATRRSSSRR